MNKCAVLLMVLVSVFVTLVVCGYARVRWAEPGAWTRDDAAVPDPPPSSIFIRSFETRPLENLIRIHVDNLTAYAARHGYNYTFNRTTPKFALELPVYWVKLQLAAELFDTTPAARVFMWIDTDAIVARPEVAIADVLRESPSSSVFIGKDHYASLVKRWRRTTLCAGVFLVRNNRVGRAFVHQCLAAYVGDRACRDASGKPAVLGRWGGRCYEQGVMNKVCRSAAFKDHVFILGPRTIRNCTELDRRAWVSHVFGDKANTEKEFVRFSRQK